MAPGGGVHIFGDGGPSQYRPHLRYVPICPPPEDDPACSQAGFSFFLSLPIDLDHVLFFYFINFGIDFSVMEDANNSFAIAYLGTLSTVCVMIHCSLLGKYKPLRSVQNW
jgi:hypothetical protein